MGAGVGSRGRFRHVVRDDGELGFEVDAPGFVTDADGVARRDEVVGPTLVDERFPPEGRGQIGAPRLAQQLDVIDVSRPVQPLIRARQWRCGGRLIGRLVDRLLPKIELDAVALEYLIAMTTIK